jgi:hypothetical protein
VVGKIGIKMPIVPNRTKKCASEISRSRLIEYFLLDLYKIFFTPLYAYNISKRRIRRQKLVMFNHKLSDHLEILV